jgi:transcriptional regulator with XRE-family HTH domain
MSPAELQAAREHKKLSRAALARQCGLSQAHIINLEHGTRPLTLDCFRALDRVLHFPHKVLIAFIRNHGSTRAVRFLTTSAVLLTLT